MDDTIIARLNAYADDSVEADRIIIALLDRVVDLEAERDSSQQVAYAALDRLHSTTMALDRTRAQLHRLTAEVRMRSSLQTSSRAQRSGAAA